MLVPSAKLLARKTSDELLEGFFQKQGKGLLKRANSKRNPYSRHAVDLEALRERKPAPPPPTVMTKQFFKTAMVAAAETRHDYHELARIGVEAFEHDPRGGFSLSDLEHIARCVSQPMAVRAMEQLIRLAKNGELALIMQGEQTRTARTATFHQLATSVRGVQFGMHETVVDKETSRAGSVIDICTKENKFLVAFNPIEVEWIEAGRLVKAAKQIPRHPKVDASKIRELVREGLPERSQPIGRTSSVLGTRAMENEVTQAARAALRGLRFPSYPALRYEGLRNIEYVHENGNVSIAAAVGAISAKITTPLGAQVRLDIPVPIRRGKVYKPELFFYGTNPATLDQDSINKLFAKFNLKSESPSSYFTAPPGIPGQESGIIREVGSNPDMFPAPKVERHNYEEGFSFGNNYA